MNRRIPLFQPAVQNVDQIQLKSFAARLVDGYIDEAEFINRRPGHFFKYSTQISAPVDNLFYWAEEDEIYTILDDTLVKVDTSPTALDSFSAEALTRRPTFLSIKIAGVNTMLINHGTKIYSYDKTAGLVNLTDTDADITWGSLDIATIDSYGLSISADGTMHYSNVLDATDWDGDFVQAEDLPDGLVAIKVVGDTIFLFGNRSIERWYNDGSTPFVRFNGSSLTMGTFSPDTIQVINQTMLFINDDRRLVALREGTPQVISAPFDKTIQSFGDVVSNAYADSMMIGGKTFYVLTFPSFDRSDYDGSSQTGVTFVYDYTLDRWYEWAQYDTGTADYGPYLAKSYVYKPSTAQHFIGTRESDGWIYEVSPKYYWDLKTNTQTFPWDIENVAIRTLINSGYFDHGTLQKKQVNRFMCRLKKGDASGDSTPGDDGVVVSFRYRDEASADYGNTITVDMSDKEDIEFFVKEGPLGQYRARQYEVTSSSKTPFIMGAVEEDITLLDQ